MARHVKPWTAEETQILKEAYPVAGIKGTAALLPGRSENAVRTKAQEMRVETSKEARRHFAREAAIRGNEAMKLRKQLEAERAEWFAEYEQASDIFQVGFRIACRLGVLEQYARRAS